MVPQDVIFTGTQINYYFVCKTKLWFFSHFIAMEPESDAVRIGKIIHETSFVRMLDRGVIIDDRIGIDFIERNGRIIIHEVKKSNRLEKAHRYQLYYYMYYLKRVKGIDDVAGELNYPKMRKKVYLSLNEDIEMELEKIIEDINRIVSMPHPPPPERKTICRKCSYYDLCWV
ncbi:MAG: CRISPR-associated protein Cas4 [Thermoplasmata archaeon]|nr:MAG: CRISPR-associated protein Cas4 [Thermoplasmata archaeon]